MDKDSFIENIKISGIVGAGGAGFPTYVKANSKAELVIVNAAECEPLLRKDQIILEHYMDEVIGGIKLLIELVGADKAIIGIKKKHEKLIEKLKKRVDDEKNISVYELGDFYPAGDEFCLVYETTGRVIPPGGLPLNVGCVVNNVETLYNIYLSSKTPVTEKFVTVAGEVRKTLTIKVPLGITFQQLIDYCAGAKCKDPVIIDGGPMMGRVITDFNTPVTKTTSAIIVLPQSHPLIKKKTQSVLQFSKIGRSTCDQCSFCTEFCPRYMLGHNIQPHRVMRSLLFSSKKQIHNEYAILCCECSLCSLYSCPEGLNPREVCIKAKNDLREVGITIKNSKIASDFKQLHPVRDFRKVPVKKLIKKLGLSDYDKPAPLVDFDYEVKKVKILLSQHIGVVCKATVKVGDLVKKGDVIGKVGSNELGAFVHSSIDGKVTKLNERYVEIEKC